MKKIRMRGMFAVPAVIILMAAVMSCTSQGTTENGSITFIAGQVRMNGAAAKVGDIVAPGSVIVTGKNSLCDVVFNEKNIIRIFPGSDIILNITGQSRVIEMNSGAVASVLKKLGKTAKNDVLYQIKTSTSVASVRGTVFFVKVEDPGKTYICDCNGVVEIGDAGGVQKQTVEASHHTAFRYFMKGNTIAVDKAPMLYHDDKGVDALAEKIGVTVDWTKIDR